METSQTLPAQKSAFLRSQIRLLSAILQPSSTWRQQQQAPPLHDDDDEPTAVATAPAPLPQKILATALDTLNTRLQAHNRSAYPPQTQHHIAAQIDKLYWADITRDGLQPPLPGETVMAKDVDISTADGYTALPEAWEDLFVIRPQTSSQAADGRPVADAHEVQRYAMLRQRLEGAIAEQRRQRGRLEGYRQLGRLVEPFEGWDGGGREREGQGEELERELERLKELVKRVAQKVKEGSFEGVGGGGRDRNTGWEGDALGERQKLKNVMDVL